MKLRWYQSECIAAIFAYFQKYSGNPIAALPTGTGKSLVIAEFLRQTFCAWPGQRVIMLTHVKELIAQNFAELVSLWPTAPAGIFSAGLNRKEVRPIVFAGIKSVVGKGLLFGHVDLVLIDECHLVSPADDTAYEAFLAELRAINPKVKVIGLTATPYRLGQGRLTDHTTRDGKIKLPIFTDVCYDITGVDAFNRLIAEGYLCNLVPKKTGTQMDVSGVKIIGGEFAQAQLQDAVDKDELTYACIQEMIYLGHDRKHWLIFATGVRHCEHVATMLDSCGVSAVAVHSKVGAKERDEAVENFKSGRVRALVNPVLFTTGFNYKAIDLIGDLAPTSSASRHVQKYGRGTRPEVGKADCLVLDFAGNTRRNGPINDPVIPKRRGSKTAADGENLAPVKLCPKCATWNHNSARLCASCKAEFPLAEVKITADASTDALIVGEAPIVLIMKVDRVDYQKHAPHYLSGKPPSLRVTYHCGERLFSEWVCLEHDGFAGKKARDWWRTAADDEDTEPPVTIDDARKALEVLQRPTHLRVWVNCKAPKIMAIDFSGTAFGTELKQISA